MPSANSRTTHSHMARRSSLAPSAPTASASETIASFTRFSAIRTSSRFSASGTARTSIEHDRNGWPCAGANDSACHGRCYSGSDPSRPVEALSYARCLSLRSTFAATVPRSAVAGLGVVRPLIPQCSERFPKRRHATDPQDEIQSDNTLGCHVKRGRIPWLSRKLPRLRSWVSI